MAQGAFDFPGSEFLEAGVESDACAPRMCGSGSAAHAGIPLNLQLGSTIFRIPEGKPGLNRRGENWIVSENHNESRWFNERLQWQAQVWSAPDVLPHPEPLHGPAARLRLQKHLPPGYCGDRW